MILILDYHMGNHHSVKRKLDKLGVESIVSADSEEIKRADKIILPGVGHFGKAMAKLKELQLIEPLNQAVLVEKKPILGICLGMQLLSNGSEEGENGFVKGLGWINGKVVRFSVKDQLRFKVPQIGWNTITPRTPNRLLKGIDPGAEFYFVHSYFLQLEDQSAELASTTYETAFTSAVEKENIFGVQFHPEKSHDVGMHLLKNFVDL
jgi:imidazole glycerol-phosphate synthase subunit HisH